MTQPPTKKSPVYFTLFILFAINALNFFDRNILSPLTQQIIAEYDLSDKAIGGLGTAFTLLYAAIGIPFGRWADYGRRTGILGIGVTIWSLLTMASGRAWNYWSLFAFRLGVGVGEASCAPAATSLIADLVPAKRRSVANAVFMLGLPVGMALSYSLGGMVGKAWGWRNALLMAGVPGLIVGVVAWFLPEPERTTGLSKSEAAPAGNWLKLLGNPVMLLLIASGAIHNFNMYAISLFVSSYLQRFHHMDQAFAGNVSAMSFGLGGVGILMGGWLCDRVAFARPAGRMEVSSLAIFLSAPCYFFAIQAPAGQYMVFALLLLVGYFLSCIYYPGVYATIQDVTPSRQRGTAMALYFCAMYFLGASLGPYVTGMLSDHFAFAAITPDQPPEIIFLASAIGLRKAFYLLPALALALGLVLLVASFLVAKQLGKKNEEPAVLGN
jgi:predicted MFS family arabinose efflux permease